MFVVCDLAKNPINRYPLTDRKEYLVKTETLTEYEITDDLGRDKFYNKELFFTLISDDPNSNKTLESLTYLSNLVMLYEERSSNYNKFGNYARSKELQLIIKDLRNLARIMLEENYSRRVIKGGEKVWVY